MTQSYWKYHVYHSNISNFFSTLHLRQLYHFLRKNVDLDNIFLENRGANVLVVSRKKNERFVLIFKSWVIASLIYRFHLFLRKIKLLVFFQMFLCAHFAFLGHLLRITHRSWPNIFLKITGLRCSYGKIFEQFLEKFIFWQNQLWSMLN